MRLRLPRRIGTYRQAHRASVRNRSMLRAFPVIRKEGLSSRRAAVMARKYVWWQDPRITLDDPRLLIAQVMTLGTLDDVRWLIDRVTADDLRQVLREPPVGIFNERSWRFWHLRLGCRPIPPLPTRRPPPDT